MLLPKRVEDKNKLKNKLIKSEKINFIKNLDNISKQTIIKNMKGIEYAEFLDSTISVGNILRVPFKGDLKTVGYEIGALVMEPGSQIKEHDHIEYIETYSVINSNNNIILDPEKKVFENFNFCDIKKIHFAKNANGYILMIYTKIKV